MTNTKQIPSFQDRLARVIEEVKGVRAQFNVTDWEWQRLQEWRDRGYDWGSDKQLKILEEIEEKVFGEQEDSDG